MTGRHRAEEDPDWDEHGDCCDGWGEEEDDAGDD